MEPIATNVALKFANGLKRFFELFSEVYLTSSERSTRRIEASIGLNGAKIVFRNSDEESLSEELQSQIEELQILRENVENEKQELLSRNFLKSDGSVQEDWRVIFLSFRQRLLDESERLRARSLANLGLGLFFSLIAVASLLGTLFAIGDDTNTIEEAIVNFLPRLTLVVLLQLIAGFFFKVYSSNESDLKQNKNEISNVDYRYVASVMADEKSREAIVAKFMSEERNFVLQKGDQVAGRSEIVEMGAITSIAEKVADKIGSGAKKGKQSG